MEKRNIRLLYAMSLLQGLVFYAPVATLYRRAAGLSMLEISAIESVSLLLSFLLEIPWGAAADRIGCRRTMILCSALFFVSKIIFWRADSLADFLAERVLLAVVTAGLSGVDSAMLYLSCPAEQAQRVFARYGPLGSAGMLLASALYSLCFGENYRLAGFWTMAAYGGAFLLSLGLREPPHPPAEEAEKGSAFRVLLAVLKRPRLLVLLCAFCLFGEAVQQVTVFLSQLQYERAGIPGGLYGFLLAGVTVAGFLGVCSPALTRRLGERRTALALIGAGAAACGLLAVTGSPALSVLAVAAMELAGSLFSPLASVEENRQVRSACRATELSVYAMLADALAALTGLAFGRAADRGLPLAMALGCGLCCLSAALYLAAGAGRGKISAEI